jgi:WD40 repeat protein
VVVASVRKYSLRLFRKWRCFNEDSTRPHDRRLAMHFPTFMTKEILQAHTDEVWNLEWSHSGEYIASASKDKSAVIWRLGLLSVRACSSDSDRPVVISLPFAFRKAPRGENAHRN